ncbi:phage tail protein [Undibacterium terreum]|uniref:Phage tail protein n=1 Tax=Undibacterium terreum TaxID=1224302 RepID=A0A916ULQ6_9BURK|nr:phage tail protein [Undibacterium terreum]GGC76742.1 phage tail protein [Undibacterium terreum]
MSGDYFEDGYPPPAFYFTVGFGSGNPIADTAFNEVSGIGTEIETESVVEGGENRFVHQLPKQLKHGNLELKRGIAQFSSPLVGWCRATLEGEFSTILQLRTIIVKLNGEKKQVLRAWEFNDAYPVKWSVDAFNSTKNEVAIEKIAFAYSFSKRTV